MRPSRCSTTRRASPGIRLRSVRRQNRPAFASRRRNLARAGSLPPGSPRLSASDRSRWRNRDPRRNRAAPRCAQAPRTRGLSRPPRGSGGRPQSSDRRVAPAASRSLCQKAWWEAAAALPPCANAGAAAMKVPSTMRASLVHRLLLRVLVQIMAAANQLLRRRMLLRRLHVGGVDKAAGLAPP